MNSLSMSAEHLTPPAYRPLEASSLSQFAPGETLPLFPANSGHSQAGLKSARQTEPVAGRAGRVDEDLHMQAARQLAMGLRGVKPGYRRGRRRTGMSLVQRRQVGNAICEHLLASLREQIDAEDAARRQARIQRERVPRQDLGQENVL